MNRTNLHLINSIEDTYSYDFNSDDSYILQRQKHLRSEKKRWKKINESFSIEYGKQSYANDY